MLELKSLCFSYGKAPWIEDLSLTVRPGAVTGLIGPNGSGKSTVLKLCAGLLRPRRGAVCLDGADLRAMRARDRAKRIALLRQGPRPSPLQAGDVVLAGRYPHRGPGLRYSPRDHDIARRAMEAAGCAELADRCMDRLSGGEQQRVLMASALAQDTGVLLLDEPTASLDAGSSIAWMRFLRELNRERPRMIAVVLHDLGLALQFCDHIVVMDRGRVAASGTAAELLDSRVFRDVFHVDVRSFRREDRQYYCVDAGG